MRFKNCLQTLALAFLVMLVASPIKALTQKNTADDVWSRVGWNLGWATGCNALPYSATRDPHKKVQALRDKGLISEREYKNYSARRNKFLKLESAGCNYDDVKGAVDAINRYLDGIDK